MKFRELAAEFFGTYCLVFAGTGAVVINGISGGAVTHVGISLTFGLVVLAMIYSIGDISGAHLNPAVTLGFCTSGRMAWRKLLPYAMSQVLGALAASGTLRALFGNVYNLGATNPAGSLAQSFLLELILTAILMFVILNVSLGSREKGITAGIAVGATIGLEALFAGPICGASMNPARSLGPALLSGDLRNLWIYLAAPTCGALVGVVISRCVQGSEKAEAAL